MRNCYLKLLFTAVIFNMMIVSFGQNGLVYYERWSARTDKNLMDTYGAPSATLNLTSIDAPSDISDNFVSRIRGFIIPPATGNYTFYVASDDDSDFFLSTDASSSNKGTRRCYVTNWAEKYNWTREANQKSAAIALTQGTKYYFEVNHHEGSGGDHVEVGWTGPAPIGSTVTVIGSAYIATLSYDITFNVKKNSDNTNIEGAVVEFNGTTKNTDVNGNAVFTTGMGDNLTYKITAPSLVPSEGTINVTGNATVNLKLFTATSTVTFNVKESSTNISNASVSFNGETKLTDVNGNVNFTSVNPGIGKYYQVSKLGYSMVSGTLTVANLAVSQNVTISNPGTKYILAFNITDNFGNKVRNAIIEVMSGASNLGTIKSDEYGYVELQINNGTSVTQLTVSKENYASYFENSASPAIASGDFVKSIVLNAITSTVVFQVLDQNLNAVLGALVKVDGQQANTDINGEATFELAVGNNKTYTVEKEFYTPNPYSGTVDVGSIPVSQSVTLNQVTYTVSFSVKDASGNALVSAKVDFNNQTQYTNTQGNTTFSGIPNGTDYGFTVFKSPLLPQSGKIDVSGANVTKNISLYTNFYKVVFNVQDKNNSNLPLPGVEVVVGEKKIITDSQGKVEFDSIPDGTGYIYSMTKEAYKNRAESFNVSGNTTVDVVMERSLYKLTFKVLDQLNNIVPGAAVNFKGSSLKTDANGLVSFDSLEYELNVDYSVTRNGYETKNGTLNIDNNKTQTVVITRTATPIKVTFNVTDNGANPLANAQVSYNYQQIATDALGKAEFQNIIPGETASYSISLPGYKTENESLTANKDTSVNITMITTQTFSIVVNVNDGKNSMDSVYVQLGGNIAYTKTGKVTFTNIEAGNNIILLASKAGYTSKDTLVNVVNQNLNLSLSLKLITYNVTFSVKNQDALALKDVVVKFGGVSDTTDSMGIVVYQNILPKNGIAYEVSKAAYIKETGAFDVQGNITKFILLNPVTYKVTFNVKEEGTSNLKDAEVTFNNKSYLTDSLGNVEIFGVLPGIGYNFSITKLGYTSNTGKLDVSNANIKRNISIFKTKTYNVVYTVKNINSVAMAGATVVLGVQPPQSKTSDIDGKVVYTGLSVAENIRVTITKTGYIPVIDTIKNLNADVFREAILKLQPITNKITIRLKDDAQVPIPGARVNIDGVIDTTDSLGIAVLSVPSNNAAKILITKAAYKTIDIIKDASKSVSYNISMPLLTFNVTFLVFDETDNVISGAKVTLLNYTSYTNSGGKMVFGNLVEQQAGYMVELPDGYSKDSGSFVIQKDTTLTIRLKGVGINDAGIQNISVHPNPVTDFLLINGADVDQVELYNAIGSKVYQTLLPQIDKGIDLSFLPKGIYVVKINNKGVMKQMIKIIKQ